MTSLSLAGDYQRFEGTFCHHLISGIWRQNVPPKFGDQNMNIQIPYLIGATVYPTSEVRASDPLLLLMT